MNVHDSGACLGGINCRVGDLFGSYWNFVAFVRRLSRAGNGAGDK
jgi:hypothetical protein